MYTHIMHLDLSVDIRDRYIGAATVDALKRPLVAILPDGTVMDVSFVQRVNHGQLADHKVAFLNRALPGWPTDTL
jgi:hypothetical protein